MTPHPPSLARYTLLAVLCSGCASTPRGQLISASSPRPAVAAVTRDTIVFLGVQLPSTGSAIGAHHDGLAKVRQYTIYLSADLESAWSQGLRDVGTELFGAAGYRLRIVSPLFSQLQSYEGVQQAIAGRVTSLTVNTYGRLAGGRTTASMTLDWEVLDLRSRNVIFRRQTYGEASVGGTSGAAVSHAFRAALQQLLAGQAFAGAFAQRSVPAAARSVPIVSVSWTRPLPAPSELITVRSHQLNPYASSSPLERALRATAAVIGSRGRGSAFIITRTGFAITNHHVVAGQEQLEVRLTDGRRRPARVIRSDSLVDVALIEIQCDSNCPTLELDPALTADVGAEVMAIGTPIDESLTNTVTRGIVSGLRLDAGVTLVQTDAAVNPGNSGGPLIDTRSGRALAVVTFKLTGRAEGLGFGVSIPDAMRVLGLRYQIGTVGRPN